MEPLPNSITDARSGRFSRKYFFLSRLFKTNYENKETYLGPVRYNLHPFKNILSPLGGINKSNLNYLKNIRCDSLALSSAFTNDDLINKLFY